MQSSESSDDNQKRKDYIEWDEYFMATALLELNRDVGTSSPSKKERANVALILNARKIITSIAINEQSTNYERHAELKAIQKASEREVMYSILFPCGKCAQEIINAKIKEVIYLRGSGDNEKTEQLFKENGVTCRKFISDKKEIEIDFAQFDDELPMTPP